MYTYIHIYIYTYIHIYIYTYMYVCIELNDCPKVGVGVFHAVPAP